MYVAQFKERDAVRFVYRRLKDAYERSGGLPSEIKMRQNELCVPDKAVSLLERIAGRLQAKYRVERQ
jgi:hypothetical protein